VSDKFSGFLGRMYTATVVSNIPKKDKVFLVILGVASFICLVLGIILVISTIGVAL
jgi:hypothetical protein